MDRLSSGCAQGTLNYTYDGAGNLASMQSADGAVNVSYAWNGLNQLEQVIDSRLGTTTYPYDTANNVSTMTYPNQVQTTFTYDQLNRVSSAASRVAGYTYQRGPTGNLTNVVELGGRNVNWSYDGIYRLTNESIANDRRRITARKLRSRSGGQSALRSVISREIPSGSWGFISDDELSSESYDANGNVTAAGARRSRTTARTT